MFSRFLDKFVEQPEKFELADTLKGFGPPSDQIIVEMNRLKLTLEDDDIF